MRSSTSALGPSSQSSEGACASLEDGIDANALLNEIYASTFDYGIFTIDLQGTVRTWNVGAERITGFSVADVLGQNHAIVFTAEDRTVDEPQQEIDIARAKGRAEDYRWHVRKDGSRFWADGVLTPIHDTTGETRGFLKIFRDITERRVAEEALYRAANTDRLTGLGNRYAVEMHAKDFIASTLRNDHKMALHLIDLDRFKNVNDRLGHQAGDELLRQAAERMRLVVRDGDFLGRLGGDEFVILQPATATTDAAAALALKINTVLAAPFVIHDQTVQLSASIGIAVYPTDALDLDHLLKKADLALYRTKQSGKGSFHFFANDFDSAAQQQKYVLTELRQAIDATEFTLAYQPKIRFTDGQILGVEALLRCTRPSLAAYAMDDLVSFALSAGLMKPLSLWILDAALRQVSAWHQSGMATMMVSVNLCADDLTDPGTPVYIDRLLAQYALQPSHLEIEITERQALDIEKDGRAVLDALRASGIAITLDDFGTGFSALSYLRNLPVTTLKLDKSFLTGIPDNEQGCAVIKAVIDLARALGLTVVAEGVETTAQAAFLKNLRCTAFQGFLATRPLSGSDMMAWILARQATPLAFG